jgi:hypothetical protein
MRKYSSAEKGIRNLERRPFLGRKTKKNKDKGEVVPVLI